MHPTHGRAGSTPPALSLLLALSILLPFSGCATPHLQRKGAPLEDLGANDDGGEGLSALFEDDEEEGHSDRRDPTFSPRVTGRRRDRGGR